MKKVPMRMCVVTREKLPKKELIRVVKSGDLIIVDETGKLNGKGCYMQMSAEVIKLAQKQKVLNKVFEIEVPEDIYDEILKKI